MVLERSDAVEYLVFLDRFLRNYVVLDVRLVGTVLLVVGLHPPDWYFRWRRAVLFRSLSLMVCGPRGIYLLWDTFPKWSRLYSPL